MSDMGDRFEGLGALVGEVSPEKRPLLVSEWRRAGGRAATVATATCPVSDELVLVFELSVTASVSVDVDEIVFSPIIRVFNVCVDKEACLLVSDVVLGREVSRDIAQKRTVVAAKYYVGHLSWEGWPNGDCTYYDGR